MSPLTGGESYWMASVDEQAFAPPPLAADVEADVCIVGAGATGVLAAWELAQDGVDVVLLDQRGMAESVTGYTTAKLTSQHGLKYAMLEQRFGLDVARWYGAVNQRALERIVDVAEQVGAPADIERRDAWIYASHADTVHRLHAEADAAARAGLPAAFVEEVPLPWHVHGGVRFTGQAQLHPRRLLLAVARRLVADGAAAVHGGTSVTEVEQHGDRVHVHTEGGHTVSASHVLLATLLPTPLGGGLRRHVYCHQGYAVAMPVDRDPIPDGMFINADRPMRSLRTIPTDGGTRLLQVGGSAWVEQPSSDATPWDDLETWAAEQFSAVDAQPARWRWTTQDYSSSDGCPIVGPLEWEGRVHVATGFGGWGLTTAGVAAERMRDAVRGESRDWHAIFDPTRALPKVDTKVISAHRSGLDMDPDAALGALAPDTALVLEVDGEEVAAYREPDGTLHTVSAACTHLGGIVLWDQPNRRWSCPCHGSCFAPDGTVLHGPAKEPLPPRAG